MAAAKAVQYEPVGVVMDDADTTIMIGDQVSVILSHMPGAREHDWGQSNLVRRLVAKNIRKHELGNMNRETRCWATNHHTNYI